MLLADEWRGAVELCSVRCKNVVRHETVASLL